MRLIAAIANIAFATIMIVFLASFVDFQDQTKMLIILGSIWALLLFIGFRLSQRLIEGRAL